MFEGIIKSGWQLAHLQGDMIKLCKSAANCFGTCHLANLVHPSKFALWTKCRANHVDQLGLGWLMCDWGSIISP